MIKQKLTDEQKKVIWELYQENIGTSWDMFAELCNKNLGTNYNESTFRKFIQIGLSFLKTVKSKELAMINLLETRKTNNLLKSTLNKQISLNAQFNILKEELKKTIKDKPILKKEIKINKIKKDKKHLFIISDIQEDGANYSNAIFDKCYIKICEIIEDKKLKEIEIWENGDGIDGALRTSALAQNTKSVVGQMQIYWNALANFLYKLSLLDIKIIFTMVTSNHTELRLFGTPRGAMKEDDVTYLIYDLVKEKLSNINNIIFNGVGEFFIHDYCNYNVYQHHGDNKMNVKNLEQYFKDICAYYEPVDYVIVSHVHHMRYTTVNSGKKGNDYAVLTTPALDPRTYKNNEIDLMLSSQPSFLYVEFTDGIGISEIRKLHTNIILNKKPETKIIW